ncbi:branched-chain-amino-acid aminotransferase, cytosolic-like [Uloborus diversus]|uniref:branched-chain-amino-acid aminotransferase, cytosolic-like n=1 Tax=Uloborus diversus TaxID=327109 RepID=UPI00240A34C3|nr:branched-chain-amino-acid aminotransferase, cytosolic-like [Uloborus diversus]
MALTTNMAVLLRCLNISRKATKVIFPSVTASRNKHDSFKFSDLQIQLASSSQRFTKPDPSKLKFGEVFSDHMFEVEWNEDDGWGVPRILPLHDLHLHPGAKILHYAQGVFEGMKAFKYSNEQVALFRPEMNVERLLVSSERAALPPFDKEEFLKCLKKLVTIDKSWIPDTVESSLYIRPTYIGHQSALGIHSSSKALLFVVTCPVGAYFSTGRFTPVSLLADPQYVRAWPGGVGDKKMASNYGPTLHAQKVAQRQGLQQVLWLLGEDHYITEAGGMNIFFLIKNAGGDLELVTPPLDGTILPGVMRRSVLDLTKKWDEFSVVERRITMKDVILANNEGRLVEMFSTGTAVCICPVGSIRYNGQDIKIPTTASNSAISARLYKAITDIQYGRVKSEWSVVIE